MRLGDYFVVVLMSLNLCAAVAYAWQGFYRVAFYWSCVTGINWCLLKL